MRRVDLLHRDLSYQIVGICFKIHNYLGTYRNEKQYCDAIEYACNLKGIYYEREKVLPLSFEGEQKGRNRVDFMIENKIILEIKRVPGITRNEYHQSMRYLASCDKDLCLLINFYPKALQVRRILNPKLINKN